jgi:hypothetical protein
MTRVLALVGIVAILLWLRIPQRINWDELRGFKGADQLEQQLDPLRREFTPASPSPTKPATKPTSEPAWMKVGCRSRTVRPNLRLSRSQYQQHLFSDDVGSRSNLAQGIIPPYCLHENGDKVFIPDWLVDRRYRLRISDTGEEQVEQMGAAHG